MEKIVFSVIMPCYNSKDYVEQAILSITNQTYPYWELIAINDGSKDNTLDILNNYADNDNRIKVFSKENGGYVSAVNYGLEKISGDYFLFLGSDDALSLNLFESLANHLNQKLPDIISFNTMKKIGNRQEPDEFACATAFAELFDCNIVDYENKFPQNSKILFVRDTSKCFKRSLLGNLRYFGKSGMDADGIFSMLFVDKCTSFISVPVVGYLWTLREDSLSGRPESLKVNIDKLENWLKFFNIKKDYSISNMPDFEATYLNYVLRIIKNIYQYNYDSVKTNKQLITELRHTIMDIAKKYKINLALKYKLFLFFPNLFVLYAGILGLFKNTN